ncbi:hypothetical protein IC762_01345 [Bradyrhizobium genosp. L]|uniref:hypothetical protein n=1 Tax=Bradyrhizobium genosp. L TaxID=83637 RepID=UPI0018A283C0|nr:hypothetical protein [Bradyrhizobium genosp. L]QPF85012.1 hypothetical protein IC762_01345 [Bradyrhizobium genosp. L]
MRKLILITVMVLASASAQAGGTRSLSMRGGESSPAVAPVAAKASDRIAQAPVVEPPPQPPETPKYVERPSAVAAPATATTPAPPPQAQPAKVQSSSARNDDYYDDDKPSYSHASGSGRYSGRWTEGRIIRELHRHGIYW